MDRYNNKYHQPQNKWKGRAQKVTMSLITTKYKFTIYLLNTADLNYIILDKGGYL